MQLQLDPGIPTNLSPEEMRDFKTFIDTALDSLTTAAGGEIFTTGNAMLAGLAIIVVILNGLKIAFSGNIQPWELVRVVIGLWIPWVMLQFYMTTIPGMAFTFPGMIAGGGNWLHDLLIGDAVYSMLSGLGDLGKSLWANITTQGQQGSILGVLSGGAHALKMALIGLVMMVFIFLMLLVLFAVTYAQVIWAHIALAILIYLGSDLHSVPGVRAAVIPVLGLVPGDDYLLALWRDCRNDTAACFPPWASPSSHPSAPLPPTPAGRANLTGSCGC